MLKFVDARCKDVRSISGCFNMYLVNRCIRNRKIDELYSCFDSEVPLEGKEALRWDLTLSWWDRSGNSLESSFE